MKTTKMIFVTMLVFLLGFFVAYYLVPSGHEVKKLQEEIESLKEERGIMMEDIANSKQLVTMVYLCVAKDDEESCNSLFDMVKYIDTEAIGL